MNGGPGPAAARGINDGAWDRLRREIAEFRAGIRGLPVARAADAGALRSHLAGRYGFEVPIELGEVVGDVARLLRESAVQVTHPRYFGLFNPSTLEAGVLADALAAAFNPQLGVWSHAPAAQELERHVLRHLARLLGFDADAVFANFTTGGTEANLSAVLAAIAHREPASSWDGVAALAGAPAIYVTGQTHDSFVKIARMTGLGTAALRPVATTDDLAMDPAALRAQVAADTAGGREPLLIVATAGSTAMGHVDPLDAIADVAAEFGIWYHVDAAWGGAAAFSPALRPFLRGIERADSVTWDAHKWLSVPMGAGMVFCRHPEALRRAFDVSAAYMPAAAGGGTDDLYLMTAQWSRRAIGLKVFMALAELGTAGYRDLIEHQTRMGDLLRRRLTEAGWIITNRTPLPVVCFTHRVIRERQVTAEALLRTIYDRGRVWISRVAPAGRETVLRACITSYLSRDDDIDAVLEELDSALRHALRAPAPDAIVSER